MDEFFETHCVYMDKEKQKEYRMPKTFSLDTVVEFDQAAPDTFQNEKAETLVITAHGSAFFITTPYNTFAKAVRERAKYRKMGL